MAVGLLKNFVVVAIACCWGGCVLAQDAPPGDYVPRGMDELKQLVAPVALYPDAALAQVFVACTYPDDVLAANDWVNAGRDASTIDAQPWDDSVKGVARFPDVLKYLASHADWMNDLGDSFLHQQADVMAAVQEMRSEAAAAGNLQSNDDEQVVSDGDITEIIPTNPDYLYIPIYDPALVYVTRPYRYGEHWEPLIRWGPRVSVGGWLRHDLDWRDHRVYFGDWGRDRPWWHVERGRDGGFVQHYADDRPGNFGRGIAGREVRSSTWQRDVRKPAPRIVARPGVRGGEGRPGAGYPERAPAAVPREYDRGATVNRESARGQESRERAGVRTPAPAAVRPVAPAPRVQPRVEPARSAPQPARAAPQPAARPSVPERGGAISGYERGGEASRASERGSSSRGAAAGGGGGHSGHR